MREFSWKAINGMLYSNPTIKTSRVFKSLGTLLGVEVVAALPENPMESSYCFCKFNNKSITVDVVSLSREQWDNPDILNQCFNYCIGIGITVALERKLITKD